MNENRLASNYLNRARNELGKINYKEDRRVFSDQIRRTDLLIKSAR